MNNRLSEVMRVLTVIATIMMPLSLIAGLYGMNVSVPGGDDSPVVFWFIVGGMGALAAGMRTLFRVKRWI